MLSVLARVREFIERPDPPGFDDLALDVFRFQYERNAAYRIFCERRKVDPERVRSWTDVPAVPVVAFKHVDLSVAGVPPGALFLTSGTTRGSELRGRHRVPDPSIYRTAALRNFRDCVLSDEARPVRVVLAPSPDEEAHSSLARMIGWIDEALGDPPARYFVHDGELDHDGLVENLRGLEPKREPVLVIGLTHAFIRFMDRCRAEGVAFRLPYGSRIVDTGGTKGRSRSMSRAGLLRAFWEAFGVPGYFVVNEYGMTEMCSQFYDSSIRDHVEGRKRDRHKLVPAWVRTRILSPETGSVTASGGRGLLCHFDLANVGSVAAIETEDLGIAVEDGFEVCGRAPGAEVRGCALLLHEVVT